MTPPVGVVVITRNRREELLSAIDRLCQLPERPEVVVVDNGSGDGSVAAVRDVHPHVRIVALDRNLGAAARNVGVAAMTTPYVAFADDDSGWESGALARAVDVLEQHPRLALLAATVLNGEDRRLDPTSRAMAQSPLPAEPDLPGRPVLGFMACGAVVRREPFLQVGGFRSEYGVGGEETPLAVELVRAGYGAAYVAEVVARHWPSPVRDVAAREATAVRNDLWFAWEMRRSGAALALTVAALRRAVREAPARRGVADALRGATAVMARRRPVEPWLERRLQVLDAVRT